MMFIGIIVIGVVIYMFVEKGTLGWDRFSSPLNLLDERLARGEVSVEDYQKLKEELRRM